MKKYKYIFHFVSGQSYVLTAPKTFDLTSLISRTWFYANEGEGAYCINDGVAFNTNNIEFIEVQVINEK